MTKSIDRKTGEPLHTEFRAEMIRQLQIAYRCFTECDRTCGESMYMNIVRDGRADVEKLCKIGFTN